MPKQAQGKKFGSVGQRGEFLVAEKLLSYGWIVAQPLSSASVFDLLVGKGGKIRQRVQVKSTLEQHSYKYNRPHYQFILSHGASVKKRYTATQIDFFICCALDAGKFWILPFKAATATTLKIYNGEDSKFHRYEDAWELLGCPRQVDQLSSLA